MKKYLLSLSLGLLLASSMTFAQQTAVPGADFNVKDCSKENKPPTTQVEGAQNTYYIKLQEPLIDGTCWIKAEGGVGVVTTYISKIYKVGAGIIGVLCVLIIVISGIQISLGGMNSEMVNQGKERIIQALLSLLLLFGSALILKTINPGFFV